MFGKSIMPKTNWKHVVALSSLILTCTAASSHAQGRINTQPEVKKPAIEKIRTQPAGEPIYQPLRVPDVLGLFVEDAEKKLLQLGLKWKEIYLAQPDPSLRRGHVLAVVPAVRSVVQPGDIVELRIPRAATVMGKGKLGLSDVERRMGFDLDTGRYEEMCSGADFVLLKAHDKGNYRDVISATGSAKLWDLDEVSDVRFIPQMGLGSYGMYVQCEYATREQYNQRGNNFVITVDPVTPPRGFCVLTSKKQIGVVFFTFEDQSTKSGDLDYVFQWAIFEQDAPFRPTELPPVKIRP